jgi:hypothetical protein
MVPCVNIIVEESFKMISYVERNFICSGGSVLPAVSFENGVYIFMKRVYFEIRNKISVAFRLLSNDADFGEDHASYCLSHLLV